MNFAMHHTLSVLLQVAAPWAVPDAAPAQAMPPPEAPPNRFRRRVQLCRYTTETQRDITKRNDATNTALDVLYVAAQFGCTS